MIRTPKGCIHRGRRQDECQRHISVLDAQLLDRLSQLQQRQQDDWRRRIGRSTDGAGVAGMAAELGGQVSAASIAV